MKILARCQFCLLTVCVHSRGMASLGVTSDQYGSLLIPIIMSKLLSEIRLQIARNSKDSVWKMDEFSNVMKMARWRKQARTENHPKHQDMPNFVINPHFSVLWSHSKVRAAKANVSFVETCIILPLAMLLRITLNEETFWNEINDVLIACEGMLKSKHMPSLQSAASSVDLFVAWLKKRETEGNFSRRNDDNNDNSAQQSKGNCSLINDEGYSC